MRGVKEQAGRALRRLFYGHCRRRVGFTASPLQPVLLSTTLSTQNDWKDKNSDVKNGEFLPALLWGILVLLLWCFPITRGLPGWSSWVTPPTSSLWWAATPEPRLWSSRPLSSRTLWWCPGAAAPACSYSSSFPATKQRRKRTSKNQTSTKTLLQKQEKTYSNWTLTKLSQLTSQCDRLFWISFELCRFLSTLRSPWSLTSQQSQICNGWLWKFENKVHYYAFLCPLEEIATP